ncbi:class I SAM-dependent methyltransferase [Thermostichus vulcanus]|uniref:Class I SAM-dependent methyltransferase n=1 Tax=Thermostichus vulcanus str. 'Rupite' TaxID=2813851 RepID=A0ABT0CCY5_THEVL|nr:class I SAM-dependent methyltransferase [Thermostichus vulcanus]MCJ2543650.1 class I SAM-dependent methyltransferase [Thermostichus vulcanus str. 'Rupite']
MQPSPSSTEQILNQVRQLYNHYPFPPQPIGTLPPPGWNWRWSWPQAYAFCTGVHPGNRPVRILDAGCGSGVGTEYIAHQNPKAEIWAFDLSRKALEIAEARCQASQAPPVQFRELNVYDIDQLPGEFDFINCVGMIHHLPDPKAGIQALASKLAPGGILHLFVYGELGRHEIRLMQKAIRLLVTGSEHQSLASLEQLQAGLKVGRSLFQILPDHNRIQQQERTRWATENVDDECFADMYLHPQEIDYTIETLFELIRASGLQFLRFSNPEFWQLQRVLGKDESLLAQASQLPEKERYRLIELLDPVVAHYELFLGKPPLPQQDWQSAEAILSAIAHLSPCLGLWPSRSIFNYAYEAISLSEAAFAFLQQVDGIRTVAQIQASLTPALSCEQLEQLLRWQVLLLQPPE